MAGWGLFVSYGLTHGQCAPGLRYHVAGVVDKNAGQPAPAGSEPKPWEACRASLSTWPSRPSCPVRCI